MGAVFFQNGSRFFLLLEHMGLHLIDSRNDLAEIRQIHKTVRVEVGNADRTDFPRPVRLLHRPIRAIIVVERLMDQQQINVFALQFIQRFLNGSLCVFIPRICDPYFRCKKQFFARNAAFHDRVPHAFLVAISLRGVNAAISHLNGIQYTAHGFHRVYLINTVSQYRHLDPVIQRHKFHDSFSFLYLFDPLF